MVLRALRNKARFLYLVDAQFRRRKVSRCVKCDFVRLKVDCVLPICVDCQQEREDKDDG